ncbi:MAG: hypothetical protein AB1589_21755 [Cyanobacteriota bacterium]
MTASPTRNGTYSIARNRRLLRTPGLIPTVSVPGSQGRTNIGSRRYPINALSDCRAGRESPRRRRALLVRPL